VFRYITASLQVGG